MAQLNNKADRVNALVQRITTQVACPTNVTSAAFQGIARSVVTDSYQKAAGDLTAPGSLNAFSKQVADFTGRDMDDVLEEHVQRLEVLAQQPNEGRYFSLSPKGKLRRQDRRASGVGVTLTPAGKNQLLGWGGEAMNIAWRDFIYRMYQVVSAEKQEMAQYLEDWKKVRGQGKREFHNSVDQLVRQGETPRSAEGKVRRADQELYQPLSPGFKSAAEAICVVQGLEPTKQNKDRVLRKTIVKHGSQSFQWEHGRMRNKTRVMQATSGLDYHTCARTVAKFALEKGECLHRDQNGDALDDLTQNRINFSAAYDYNASAQVVNVMQAGPATPLLGA